MKYNEAIDMILDGGKMHRNSDKFYYKFSPEGLLHQWWKYKNEVCIETSITKNVGHSTGLLPVSAYASSAV